jgi:uncharacterized membrane protein YgcG
VDTAVVCLSVSLFFNFQVKRARARNLKSKSKSKTDLQVGGLTSFAEMCGGGEWQTLLSQHACMAQCKRTLWLSSTQLTSAHFTSTQLCYYARDANVSRGLTRAAALSFVSLCQLTLRACADGTASDKCLFMFAQDVHAAQPHSSLTHVALLGARPGKEPRSSNAPSTAPSTVPRRGNRGRASQSSVQRAESEPVGFDHRQSMWPARSVSNTRTDAGGGNSGGNSGGGGGGGGSNGGGGGAAMPEAIEMVDISAAVDNGDGGTSPVRRNRVLMIQRELERASTALLVQIGGICAILLVVSFLCPIMGAPALFPPLLLSSATLYAMVHAGSLDATLRDWPKVCTVVSLCLFLNDGYMMWRYVSLLCVTF